MIMMGKLETMIGCVKGRGGSSSDVVNYLCLFAYQACLSANAV